MLHKNLEFNQLQREVLLRKPKIISEHPRAKWGNYDYMYVGKSGLSSDVAPSRFDVSSASELKIMVRSYLDQNVYLDEMRSYHPRNPDLFETIKLKDYYPETSLLIKANSIFTFGKKEAAGLGDINVFDDSHSEILFILRSNVGEPKPTAGKEISFSLIGRV